MTASITLTNMGNVKLTGIALSSTQWHNITCPASNAETIAQLLVGATATCSASYTLTQAEYEGTANTGSFATSIRATSKAANHTLAYTVPEVTETVNIPTIYAASMTISVGVCSEPSERE